MEYIKLREINGAGNCYNIREFKAEAKAILEKEWERRNKYHDSMPGNGYTEKTWMTGRLRELELVADLLENELNRAVKVDYERPFSHRFTAGGKRMPVTREQKALAEKELKISRKKKGYRIYSQVQDRLWTQITIDLHLRNMFQQPSPKEGETVQKVVNRTLPNYLNRMIELLEKTRTLINEIEDYKLLT